MENETKVTWDLSTFDRKPGETPKNTKMLGPDYDYEGVIAHRWAEYKKTRSFKKAL